MKKLPVVAIEWLDAGSRGRWSAIGDYSVMEPLLCHSVGYLISQNKHKVVIVQSYCLSNGEAVDGFVVPRRAIKRLRHLKGRL